MKKIIACLMLLVGLFMVCACSAKEYDATIQIDNKEVKMIAHRGLSGIEVENTESAYVLAGKHTYYGIEADVRRTADGKFIMCHDETLERIAGKDINVESSIQTDLLSIPLLPKSEKNNKIEHLTTVEKYIEICKRYDKQAILELKSYFNEQEVKSLIDIIQSTGYLDRVTFISFSYDCLLYVRKYLPNQSAMYLFSKLSDEITAKLIADKIDVAIMHKELNKSVVNTFHNGGLKVNCWTVDSEARANELISMGVDYITTNILE